jgi:hypothetical protein
VRAACLVRWSREPGAPGSPEELQAALRRGYLTALEAYPGEAGPASSEGSGEGGSGGSTGASEGGSESTSTGASGGSSEGADGGASSSGRGGVNEGSSSGGGGPWAGLRPRGRVADAINHSTVAVQIASAYPSHITRAALRRAGVRERTAGGGGGSSSGGDDGGAVVVQRGSIEAAAAEAAAAAASAGSELHVVVHSNALAERLRVQLSAAARAAPGGAPLLQPAAARGAAEGGAAGSAGRDASGAGSSGGSSGGSSERPALPRAHVHVAEWCARSASQRAAAGASLLGEHVLAELLGCEDSALVMDGVAWR